MIVKTAMLALLVLLAGCASGPPLVAGSTTEGEIVARKGPPALVMEEADGVKRMFWPTGPMGTSTIMARFDKQQRLLSYEEVLDTEHFGKIQPGMSMEEVVREIGPRDPGLDAYFKARDEIAWEYRYCDSWSGAARFNVLFDGASRKVRSTMSLTEAQRFGGRSSPSCGQVIIQWGPAAATVR